MSLFTGTLIDTLLYFLILYLLHPSYSKGIVVSKLKINSSILLAVVFCVFAFWAGDYKHTEAVYDNMRHDDASHFEKVYIFIAHDLNVNYHLFRLIIWGSTILLIVQTFKRLKMRLDVSLFICFGLYLPMLSYARVSLAMALMFYGFSYVAKPWRGLKYLSYLFGGLIIWYSSFFHRSAIFGVFIIIASYIFGVLKGRWKMVLFILLYPTVIYMTSMFLEDFMLEDAYENTIIATDNAQRYLEGDERYEGWGIFLQNIIYRTPFYLMAYMFVKQYMDGIIAARPFINYSIACFLTVAISTVFIFDLGYNTYVMYYRFLNFAMIPMAVTIAYFIVKGKQSKEIKWVVIIGIAATIYTLIYRLWQSLHQ